VALVLALAVLATGIVSAAIVSFLPTLPSQRATLAVLAVCFPLGVVLASGVVMFGMHDNVKIVAVAVVSTLSALGGALLLGRRILRPLGRLRAASARLASGDLSARAAASGPRELRELGSSFNEMAASIEQLFDARDASWSRGAATTSVRRSRRSEPWSKRSRTVWRRRGSTCR
jgi:methyl-accepting chemotaxis protein